MVNDLEMTLYVHQRSIPPREFDRPWMSFISD